MTGPLRRIVETWRIDYNEVRPYSSLGYRTPVGLANLFTGVAIVATQAQLELLASRVPIAQKCAIET